MILKTIGRICTSCTSGLIKVLEILALPMVVLLCIVFRFLPKRIDVGLGPVPMINNIYWAEALRLCGYSAETFVNELYYITDDFDFICANDSHKAYQRFPILLFLRCISRYSVLYIYFNGGPLARVPVYRYLEPYLLKLSNVKIVVMPYGSDVQVFERTSNKVTANSLCSDYEEFFRRNHSKTINQIDRWSRFADIVIAAMDSIDYMYFWNRIIPCHFAIDTDKIHPIEKTEEKTIRIIHAPNHMKIKGTGFLEEAIGRLVEEGYSIDYKRIQGQSNDIVIKEIHKADIVVDQLVMGWYAMFAMEAMAAGKPCICYMRDDLIDTYVRIGCLEREDVPLISANTENIYDVLKTLIDNRTELRSIGQKSREYAIKYHSYSAIGRFFADINDSLYVLGTRSLDNVKN